MPAKGSTEASSPLVGRSIHDVVVIKASQHLRKQFQEFLTMRLVLGGGVEIAGNCNVDELPATR